MNGPFEPITYQCKTCAAPIVFAPAEGSLCCEYCGNCEAITAGKTFKEYDFYTALREVERESSQHLEQTIRCPSCAHHFSIDLLSNSGECPSCKTHYVGEFRQTIRPESILPFAVSQKEAVQKIVEWIAKGWFMPNDVEEFAKEIKLQGIYLPFWTMDFDSHTTFQGERGEIYYVYVDDYVMIDGRSQRVRKRVQRIRWYPVNGATSRSFDDALTRAHTTVSAAITGALSPWNLYGLVDYDKKFVAGFESSEYAIALDSAYEQIKRDVDHIIRRDVRARIGGDRQRIHRMRTDYTHITYKNILLPIYKGAYRYRDKTYEVAVNGESGKVAGERPRSGVKILLSIVVVVVIIIGLLYFLEHSGY